MDMLDPDRPVVERIKAGEERAFDELMGRYKKPILNFIFRLLGDAHEAEDLAQDVFVRVYRRIGQFQSGRGKFSTWLFQIARHAALDRVRQRNREGMFQALEKSEDNFPSLGRNPSRDFQTLEIGRQIEAAVGELPEDQRAVVILAEYQDCSYAEIAAVMKCSEKSVESRLYRAKQSLRQKLSHLLE